MTPKPARVETGAKGHPSQAYALEHAAGLNAPVSWLTLQTNVTDAAGVVNFTNSVLGPSDFFRIRRVP